MRFIVSNYVQTLTKMLKLILIHVIQFSGRGGQKEDSLKLNINGMIETINKTERWINRSIQPHSLRILNKQNLQNFWISKSTNSSLENKTFKGTEHRMKHIFVWFTSKRACFAEKRISKTLCLIHFIFNYTSSTTCLQQISQFCKNKI